VQFSAEFPDILRSNILASQLISKTVKLKKRGKEYSGLCPFHNEKTPSFTVNDQKGFYHCFGCGAHGDIITYMMNKYGLDFKEAVLNLANDFSIEIPQVKSQVYQNQPKTDLQYEILKEICQFFCNNLYLESSADIRSYLKSRGINGKIAKKFLLGFAPNSYSDLINFLKSKQYLDEDLLKTGVISKNDRDNLYDKLRNRIVFPILDKKKRVIAFGGRVIDDAMPKYLNSAETDLFKKRQTLYNFSLARNAIFKESCAIIVEGYMDVIKLSSNGIENVVAGLGTALSDSHLTQLFSITDKIIMCLDGDNAGILAAKRACEVALSLISSSKNIHFAFLPDGLDPDDFVTKYGASAFRKVINNSTPMSQAMIDFAISDLQIDKAKQISPEDKARLESYLNKKAGIIKDDLSRKYLIQHFRDFIYKLGRGGYQKISLIQKSATNIKIDKINKNSADIAAKDIICYLIKEKSLIDYRDKDFDIRELSFVNDNITAIKEHIIEIIDLQKDVDENKIIEGLEKLNYQDDLLDIKNTLAKLDLDNLYLERFRILLLQELLIKINHQYKDCSSGVDDIATDGSAISSQKINKIFDYIKSVEQEIADLVQEIN